MPPRVILNLPHPLPEVRPPLSSRAFVRALGRAGAPGGEVNLILTSATEVRRLNREFLGKDRDTDVIAFDYTEPPRSLGGGKSATVPRGSIREKDATVPRGSIRGKGDTVPQGWIWGDVFVSAEAALKQAREREIPVREELARLFLHGCLHLLGYGDRTGRERGRMDRVQEDLLPAVLALRGPRPPGRRPRAKPRPAAPRLPRS